MGISDFYCIYKNGNEVINYESWNFHSIYGYLWLLPYMRK